MTYSEQFKRHLTASPRAGEIDSPEASSEQINPVCGDRLRLTLRLRGGHIEAARFLAYGCPPTLACGAALAGMIEGLSVEEAARVTRQELTRAVGGLPARKQHAAALAIETVRDALAGAREDGAGAADDNI